MEGLGDFSSSYSTWEELTCGFSFLKLSLLTLLSSSSWGLSSSLGDSTNSGPSSGPPGVSPHSPANWGSREGETLDFKCASST